MHRWESFHSRWANAIADALDRTLPERFFAEVQIHLGTQIEAAVAEFEKARDSEEEQSNGSSGGIALHTYAPPVATMVMPALFPDEFEVQVRDASDDARVVAVVELVSPRNKDRPAARRAFASKCTAFLQLGIGLITVDTVSKRQSNMHNELVDLMQLEEKYKMTADAIMAAVAYRPARRADVGGIDVWATALTVGGTLPVLPLALLRHGAVPLDLEATYMEARQRARL
jgi:hypothetical protein